MPTREVVVPSSRLAALVPVTIRPLASRDTALVETRVSVDLRLEVATLVLNPSRYNDLPDATLRFAGLVTANPPPP